MGVFSMLTITQELIAMLYSRITNLSTRYRENLQLVLKDLTLHIQPGEKVEHIFIQNLV